MAGTRWLTPQERDAWVRLVAVVELLPGLLDQQLRRDSGLTHYEYFTLAMLSEAPERTLRMATLAARTNATLPRLSHVISRLEDRGLVRREPCPQDGRATNAILTGAGWDAILGAAPGHVATVRELVIDALDPDRLVALGQDCDRILRRLDPEGVLQVASWGSTPAARVASSAPPNPTA